MAKLYFTFNNIKMPDYCTYKTVSKPITPNAKTSFLSLPNADGSVDFTTRTDGKIYYEDRVIELQLQFKAKNFEDLENKAAEIGEWLKGKGDLIFSHKPNEVWKATCYQGIDYKPDLIGHFASLQVIFRCKPFAEVVTNGGKN